jgi:hypothetical protein
LRFDAVTNRAATCPARSALHLWTGAGDGARRALVHGADGRFVTAAQTRLTTSSRVPVVNVMTAEYDSPQLVNYPDCDIDVRQ